VFSTLWPKNPMRTSKRIYRILLLPIKSPIFKIFPWVFTKIFFFHNTRNIIPFHYKKTASSNLNFFSAKTQKPQKTPNSRKPANISKTTRENSISTPNSDSARRNDLESIYGVPGLNLTLGFVAIFFVPEDYDSLDYSRSKTPKNKRNFAYIF